MKEFTTEKVAANQAYFDEMLVEKLEQLSNEGWEIISVSHVYYNPREVTGYSALIVAQRDKE